jgi:hypothetical protein
VRAALSRHLFASACALLALVVALLVSACSSSTGTSSTGGAQPTVPVDASEAYQTTACAPNADSSVATSYAGWPGSGQIAADDPIIPYLVSSELTVGPNRVLMTIIDQQNHNIAAADADLNLAFYNLAANPKTPAMTASGSFLDTGTTAAGFYHATADFPCWGDWGVEATFIQPSGSNTARITFSVSPTSSTPAIGAKAPPADTPTATDAAGIAKISTDTTPDPDYYKMTITQAEQAGKPAVIVFATPAFCRTATCGPTLDRVQSVGEPYKPMINFVHVEPYILQETPTGLQPVLDKDGNLQVVPAALAFGLPTEPYTFVLDAQGRVAYKFDGIMAEDELRAALEAVTNGSAPSSISPGQSATP